jgi:hypothetical protein
MTTEVDEEAQLAEIEKWNVRVRPRKTACRTCNLHPKLLFYIKKLYEMKRDGRIADTWPVVLRDFLRPRGYSLGYHHLKNHVSRCVIPYYDGTQAADD